GQPGLAVASVNHTGIAVYPGPGSSPVVLGELHVPSVSGNFVIWAPDFHVRHVWDGSTTRALTLSTQAFDGAGSWNAGKDLILICNGTCVQPLGWGIVDLGTLVEQDFTTPATT